MIRERWAALRFLEPGGPHRSPENGPDGLWLLRTAGPKGPRYRALGLLVVLATGLDALPLRSGADRESPPAVPPPKPFVMPAPTVRTLSNGLEVLVIERRELPELSLRLVVKTGAEADPPDLPGTAQIVAGLLNEGTTHRTAFQIAEAVDDAGGNVDNGADWDESHLALSVLADHAELAFDLVADMAMHPAFAPAEVDRARRQMTSSLELLKDDPEYVADTVYDELEFRGTTYGHPADGTVASAARVSPSDLRQFHDRYYRPWNAILAVVGDISSDRALALAQQYFGAWTDPTAFHLAPLMRDSQTQPASVQTGPMVGREVVIVDKPDAVQTEIRVGTPGIARTSADYDALMLANQILGGPAANRLFKALRTERGLTYGASSDLVCYRSVGTWEAKTSTRTSETMKTVETVLEEMERLRRRPLSSLELEYAKNYLVGHLALEFESSDGMAAEELDLMVHGLPLDYWNHFPERIRDMTAGQVSEALGRYLDPDRAAIVLVGDVRGFGKELRKLGPARVIPLPDLDLGSADLQAAGTP
jgi:zinc protease